MNQPDYYLAALAISILAFIIAAANFWRGGRWRDTDDGRALDNEIAAIDKRLSAVETQINGLATKADVASLKAEIVGLEREISRTFAGVQRIEDYMLERSK